MRYLITGGAGFIGSNAAEYFANQGHQITIIDNLSRKGSEHTIRTLVARYGQYIRAVQADVAHDQHILHKEITDQTDCVIHLAGQVAVTTSVTNPRQDFESNALGTFNVLEAVRRAPKPPMLIYSSTNKVYGGMEAIRTVENSTRYEYVDYREGIDETFPLDFHSPYGCSKGAGDQYVRDYARIYGIDTVVFRQSCIYGPGQYGVEDQGWVAWFLIATMLGKPITVYGDGKQVRDILYIDDLISAYERSIKHRKTIRGEVFNIGGGPQNTISIWRDFKPLLEKVTGKTIPMTQAPWRPGDQKVYVSDITKAQKLLKWTPTTSVEAGITQLHEWVQKNRLEITAVFEN